MECTTRVSESGPCRSGSTSALVASVLALSVCAALFAVFSSSSGKAVSVEFTQLTNDGRPKSGPLLTDDRNVLFTQERNGADRVVFVPVAGGDSVLITAANS
jgi:hypothetical protein